MASVEALWTVDFDTVAGWKNAGIVVLETNRVFGGDSAFYYLGHYELNGPQITGQITVTCYLTGTHQTAWGDTTPALTSFAVRLEGTRVGPDSMTGQMYRQGFPPLGVRMVKRAELP
jgi:hypothetical protein